jgi:16S rRNA (guanine527-N7)-methyltransferase
MTVREYTPPTAAEHAAERIQIVAALEQFAVVATARQLDQLQELLDRTGEANSQFNLTAIRARPDMLVKHVFDSFSLLPFLPSLEAVDAAADPNAANAAANAAASAVASAADTVATPYEEDGFDPYTLRVADIGTGAGFPGLPLAILRPDLDFLLVDSIGKKARHVGATAHGLGLDNARVENSRAEQLRRVGTFAGAFAVVTARALSSLEDFARNAGHLAAPGGRLLAMKGKVPEEELAALRRGVKDIAGDRWKVAGVQPLSVPGLYDERHLVELCRE